jgi:hypothetical protein
VISGTVTETRNGAATVKLSGQPPEKNLLWTADVDVKNYRFNDTLFFYLDRTVTAELTETINDAVKDLNLVKRLKNRSKGYTFFLTDQQKLILIRNEDNVALLEVKSEHIRETLIRMQINHFIKGLTATYDSTVQLSLYRELNIVPKAPVVFLKSGERLTLYVETNGLSRDKYYAVIHIEDEFIRQLVPVNFQVNDGECKLQEQVPSKIHLGDIVVGNLSGRFVLITSDTPIDLREILLSPEQLQKRSDQPRLNELEQLVSKLFLNRNDQSGLYHYSHIMKHEVVYQVE